MVYSHKSQKKFRKKIKQFTTGAVGLSLGAGVLQKIGGTTAGYGLTGVSNISARLPTVGTILGATAALESLPKATKKRKKKRKMR